MLHILGRLLQRLWTLVIGRPESGGRRRELNREVVEEILALYEDGFSFREIAEEVKMPLSTVHRIVRKHAPGPRTTAPPGDFEAFMQQFERFSRAMKLFNRFADEKRFEDHPLGAFVPLAEVFGKAAGAMMSAAILRTMPQVGTVPAPALPDGATSAPTPPAAQPQTSPEEASVEYLISLVHTQTPEQAAATVTRFFAQTPQTQAILTMLRRVEPTPEAARAFLAQARMLMPPAWHRLIATLEGNMDWFLGLLQALRQPAEGGNPGP